jgi:hypothetical protein
VAVALVLALALGGPGASGQAPSAGPASPPSPGVPDLTDWTAEELDAGVEAMLAADLERFGVAAFDPELPGILGELRAAATEDLGELLEDQPALLVPGATPEMLPTASPSAWDAWSLVASISGGLPGGPVRTADQGGALLSVLGSMAVEAGSFIRDVRPGPGSAVIEPPPYERRTTREVGGRQVPTEQRAVIRQSLDGSTVELTREMSETYAIPDAAGNLLASVTDGATVRLRIDVCPDEAGMIAGTVATTADTRFSASDGPGYHATFEGGDEFTVQVDDQAQPSVTQHTEHGSRRATGQRPAFGSEPAADTDATLRLESSHTSGPDAGPDRLTVVEETGADIADLRIAQFVTGLTRYVAEAARDAAASVWRGGRCLRVAATPPGGSREPGEETSLDVTVKHIVEQSEVTAPVTAALVGGGSVDPSGTPLDAPATVTYRATTIGGSDVITFETVGSRGVARVTETYVVDPTALRGVVTAQQRSSDIDQDPLDIPEDADTVHASAVVDLRLRRDGEPWVDDGSRYLVSGVRTLADGWVGIDCYQSGYVARASDEGTFDSFDHQLRFELDDASGEATLFFSFPIGDWLQSYSRTGGGCDGIGGAGSFVDVPLGAASAFTMLCPVPTGSAGTVLADGSGVRIDCQAQTTLRHGTGLLTGFVEADGMLRYAP